MGNVSEFHRAVALTVTEVSFDNDKNTSVFETTIRILGGLLGAHLARVHPTLGLRPPGYADVRAPANAALSWTWRYMSLTLSDERARYPSPRAAPQELLHKAVDIAERLLPAFNTETGAASSGLLWVGQPL